MTIALLFQHCSSSNSLVLSIRDTFPESFIYAVAIRWLRLPLNLSVVSRSAKINGSHTMHLNAVMNRINSGDS